MAAIDANEIRDMTKLIEDDERSNGVSMVWGKSAKVGQAVVGASPSTKHGATDTDC